MAYEDDTAVIARVRKCLEKTIENVNRQAHETGLEIDRIKLSIGKRKENT